MKRSLFFFIIATSLQGSSGQEIPAPTPVLLPPQFYVFDQTGTNNQLYINAQPRLFFIIVGDSSSAPATNPTIYNNLMSLFVPFPNIPNGFIPNMLSSGPAITLYFNWEDQVGFKTIRDNAKKFAQGLSTLLQNYSTPCIIISLYRAGLLVNCASHLWKTYGSKPTVLQIGTPIPTPADKYADLIPNPKNIEKLFLFYSKQPFVVEQPTLHPEYVSTYHFIPGLTLYNILVIFNNKQPIQKNLASSILIQNLINACMTAQTDYVINKNLFLNISTLKPQTNGMIGIAQKNMRTTSTQAQQEVEHSTTTVAQLENTLGRSLALSVSKGEMLRNSYRS